MNEHVATVRLPTITSTITALPWASRCYMYLEQIPTTWTAPRGAQDGLYLDDYHATTPFENWQRGRVFDQEQELKWDSLDGQFHLVYCGPSVPAGFTKQHIECTAEPTTYAYVAWGTRVEPAARVALGIQTQGAAFIELQIPRILVYPVSAQAFRMKIEIREWYGPDGRLCYSRWAGIREIV